MSDNIFRGKPLVNIIYFPKNARRFPQNPGAAATLEGSRTQGKSPVLSTICRVLGETRNWNLEIGNYRLEIGNWRISPTVSSFCSMEPGTRNHEPGNNAASFQFLISDFQFPVSALGFLASVRRALRTFRFPQQTGCANFIGIVGAST